MQRVHTRRYVSGPPANPLCEIPRHGDFPLRIPATEDHKAGRSHRHSSSVPSQTIPTYIVSRRRKVIPGHSSRNLNLSPGGAGAFVTDSIYRGDDVVASCRVIHNRIVV